MKYLIRNEDVVAKSEEMFNGKANTAAFMVGVLWAQQQTQPMFVLFGNWCALNYKPTTNNGVVLFWQKDNYQSEIKKTTEELFELWLDEQTKK